MEPSAAADRGDGPPGAEERAEQFLALSVILTGYGRVRLAGTGLTAEYLRAVEEALPGGVVDDLLHAFGRLLVGPQSPGPVPERGPDLEARVGQAILDDPRLGPVARGVILLWYCGTWTALPDAWHAAYGAPPGGGGEAAGATRVVSARSYRGGLQWAAAGAHPAGAGAQGFGAWSLPPEGGSA